MGDKRSSNSEANASSSSATPPPPLLSVLSVHDLKLAAVAAWNRSLTQTRDAIGIVFGPEDADASQSMESSSLNAPVSGNTSAAPVNAPKE
jgi:hypothetical protein